MSKNDYCLEVLFHMKARMYNLFDKNSEAIKVLKKWKKAPNGKCDEVLLNYVIGHLYEQSNNYKEALTWYKRVLNVTNSVDFTMTSSDIIEVYYALFGIANIRLNQKEYGLARALLDEFCYAYNNHKEELTGAVYYLRDAWEPVIDDIDDKMIKAQEMLVEIMKIDDIADPDPSSDIMKVIKSLETLRRKEEEREEEWNEAHMAYHIKNHCHTKDYRQAIIHYETFFKDMKLSTDEDDMEGGIEKFEKHYEDYCKCLLRQNMFMEALEFLHSGLQRILAFYYCQWHDMIKMQYKVLRHLARIYSVMGDYHKCDYYTRAQMKLAKQYKGYFKCK